MTRQKKTIQISNDDGQGISWSAKRRKQIENEKIYARQAALYTLRYRLLNMLFILVGFVLFFQLFLGG